jgi:putative transposase
MAIAYFCRDTTFHMSGREFKLNQEITTGLWQAQELRTGRFHEFSIQALQESYAEGKLIFVGDSNISIKVDEILKEKSKKLSHKAEGPYWEKAKMRRLYVKAVENLPNTESLMKTAIQEVWKKLNKDREPSQVTTVPNWTSVTRWKKKYLANGKDAYILVEQHHQKGNRTNRYDNDVMDIVSDCIGQIYMRRERGTIEETTEEAVVRVTKENNQRLKQDQLPLPTRRLVRRLIDLIPAFDRCAARYGRTAAVRIYRSKLKHIVTKKPLETAEIDHTRLDLFVIDDESHIPLGRPWLTICIDNHTRCILGIYIGFEPPSGLTVGKCLKHAFLPKTNLKKEYPTIRHAWDAHGVMEQLVVDNGLEFHGISLEKACFAFGVEIIYTPRKTPWFKGKIERFNRTLNESVSHGISGTTFSNIFEKDDYDPSKHAVMTLSALRHILHKWIADYYHQKPHRSLDENTPAAVWSSSINPEDIALAHDPAELDMLLGKAIEDKKVTHKGIEINNLLYNSPELMQLRRQYGEDLKVEIRVDESDVGHVYVILKDHLGYIEVPALNQEYASGLTLWLHEVCRSYAKKHFNKADVYSYALAKTEIREIVESELKLKRKKSNSKVGRHNDTNKQAAAKAKAKAEANNKSAIPVSTSHAIVPKVRPSYAPVIDVRA